MLSVSLNKTFLSLVSLYKTHFLTSPHLTSPYRCDNEKQQPESESGQRAASPDLRRDRRGEHHLELRGAGDVAEQVHGAGRVPRLPRRLPGGAPRAGRDPGAGPAPRARRHAPRPELPVVRGIRPLPHGQGQLCKYIREDEAQSRGTCVCCLSVCLFWCVLSVFGV